VVEDGADGFEVNENDDMEEALKEVSSGLEQSKEPDNTDLGELNNKYLRLYADFENYRKRVNKDKEELVRYGNETLLYELLPILDNLELALKHVSDESDTGLVQGVEITLKELLRTLEKFGLTRIEAVNRVFDPAVHHAMAQVERDDMEEKMVAEELRAGYLYRDKVLRPSLVMVSVKPQKNMTETLQDNRMKESEAEEEHEIKINRIIEEE
jgi:molecular chaperone GrpE